MRLKKWTAFLAGIAAVICLTACGGSAEPASPAGSEATQNSPAAEIAVQPEEPVTAAEERVPSNVPEDGLQGRIDETGETEMEKTPRLMIGDTEVSVEWENNASAEALLALAEDEPLVVDLSMYGGFEQVGPLGTSLPRNDEPTVTEAGDIVLYAGDQIVIFYGSNSWDYTRLGRITNKTAGEMKDLLGGGNVTITLIAE